VNVWLVNPFDPLPGDPEQQGRYAGLAEALAARGHQVTWWTSSFSHRFKRPVDQDRLAEACRQAGIGVRFLPTPPYRRNVSIARLRNHRALAKRFAEFAPAEADMPDVVLASAPPPLLVRQASRFAKSVRAGFVVDVQDAWPETFLRLAPPGLRGVCRLVLSPLYRAGNEAYAAADAIVGVADEYVRQASARSGRSQTTATIPLGVDLAGFDRAVAAGAEAAQARPDGHVWLVYSGSLNRSYDCLTILRAFANLRHRQDFACLHLFVTGRGELAAEAARIVAEEGLTNVTLAGFMDFPAWATLMSRCDVGFNASFPEAMIYLPNKIFWYMAAGLAVLNTIPGQCSRIVAEGGIGLDYRAGDPADCARAIARLLDDPAARERMCRRSRELAETRYDRAILLPEFAALLEGV